MKSINVAVLLASLVGWVVNGRLPQEIRLSRNLVTFLFTLYSNKLTLKSPKRKISEALFKFRSSCSLPKISVIISEALLIEASGPVFGR